MRTVGPLCDERFGLTSLGMLNVGRHRRLPITGQVGLVLCRKPALRAGKLQLWPGCPCRTPNIDRHWPRFACRTRYENGVDGMNCCVCHRRTRRRASPGRRSRQCCSLYGMRPRAMRRRPRLAWSITTRVAPRWVCIRTRTRTISPPPCSPCRSAIRDLPRRRTLAPGPDDDIRAQIRRCGGVGRRGPACLSRHRSRPRRNLGPSSRRREVQPDPPARYEIKVAPDTVGTDLGSVAALAAAGEIVIGGSARRGAIAVLGLRLRRLRPAFGHRNERRPQAAVADHVA